MTALFALAAILGSCTVGGPRTAPGSEISGSATEDDGPARKRPSIKVAVLLPLSADGNTKKVAQAMKQAGELALFDFKNPELQLMAKDTRGTAEGAKAAATEAVRDGAELIIGPLFAEAVSGAAPIAREAGVPIVAFSSNRKVAGNGVYLLSFLAGSEVRRIVSYAMSQGQRRFAALIPENELGAIVRKAFESAVEDTGGRIVALQTYKPDANSMLKPVEKIAALAKKGEEEPQFDALFLPGSSDTLPALAPLLPYFEVDTEAIRILGSNGWDYSGVGREKPLLGGWYPAAEPSGWQDFTKRYVEAYGDPPPRLASLAYDAVSLAATLSEGSKGSRYTADRLTRDSGFSGVDGLFRLRDNGLSQRGLAILEVQRFGSEVLDAAPRTFAGAQY
ncbi:MAG: penicillin-binding protein activator [Dichotomicrobium sp.]